MLKLFDYQQKLIDKTRKALIAGNRGVLIVSPPWQRQVGCNCRNSKTGNRQRQSSYVYCSQARIDQTD